MSTPQSFVMRGARDAVAAGLGHIEEQVGVIELAVVDNPGLAFDLAKTLIESTCRTVLKERSVAYDSRDDLPKLFRATTNHLPFLPAQESNAIEVRRSLEQTIGGLNTVIQSICELRNQCGFASHGSAEPRPIMEMSQARLVAEAADSIVGFLYHVHRQDRSPSPESNFEKNEEFNNYIDETYEPVTIFDVKLRPSEILFQMEPQSYNIYLTDFDNDKAEDSSQSGGGM